MALQESVKLGTVYVDAMGTRVRPINFYRHVISREEGVVYEDISAIRSGTHFRAAPIMWFLERFRVVL